MEKNPVIRVDHVSYTYEESEKPALSDVSFSVMPGEFIAVLGHNASGKSTLAKLLNALYVPSDGVVEICGMNTSDDELIWDIRRKAGMIFQNPDNQIVATVVREDVAFGMENMGIPTADMIPRIDAALESVHMTDFAYSAPHMLSGGQKQRVAIAGILAMEPEIIIADEATAMLDPSGRKEVLETIRKLNREKGITVIWITHFMEEAINADRVFIISDGKLTTSGTPADIFAQIDMIRSIHLDVPRMADIAHDLTDAGMPLAGGILTVEDMVKEVERLCPLA